MERNDRFLFLMSYVLPNHWANTRDDVALHDLQSLPADQQKNLLDALERIHNNLEGKR